MCSVRVTVGDVPVNNVYCSTDSADFVVFQVSVGSEYEYLLFVEDGRPTLYLYTDGQSQGEPSKVSFYVPLNFAHVERADKGTLTVIFFRPPTPSNSHLVWMRDST